MKMFRGLKMCYIGKKCRALVIVYVFHLYFKNELVMFCYYKLITNIYQKCRYYVFFFLWRHVDIVPIEVHWEIQIRQTSPWSNFRRIICLHNWVLQNLCDGDHLIKSGTIYLKGWQFFSIIMLYYLLAKKHLDP